ncbi:MAG: hypothetical protein U0572_02825 [Phycisphaerales bacterium]
MRSGRLLGLLVAAAIAACGCKVVETRKNGALVLPDPNSNLPAQSSGSQTKVTIKAAATIPYDGFTLPLLSPDGRYIATQTGVPPTWSTLLGTPAGGPPRASGIEVWSLEDRGGRRSFTLPKGYVLSRSADASGFLIEAPQTDGSRRIGRVRWPVTATADEPDPEGTSTLSPEWIVKDGRVNIYPVLGPDDAMAWCVRGVQETDFSLVVRRGDESFEIPAEDGQSWMLPSFASDGSIFALRVRDGVTELVHARTEDEAAFNQSMTAERLSVRCDAQRAWQALAPLDASSAVDPGPTARLLLLDLDLSRMALWNPSDEGIQPLAPDSFAACFGDDGTILWTDSDGVTATPPVTNMPTTRPAKGSGATARPELRMNGPRVYDRAAVPRRVAGDPRTWMLLVPDGRMMGIVRLTLLTPPVVVGPAQAR